MESSWSEKQPASLEERRRTARAAVRPGAQAEAWSLALRQDWRSLVLVPADSGSSAMEAARALAQTGHLDLIAAKAIDSLASQRVAREIAKYAKRGRVVVAIDPVVSNPAGVQLAHQVDAILLCITMGRTDLASARRTIQMIGRQHLIGCVTLSP